MPVSASQSFSRVIMFDPDGFNKGILLSVQIEKERKFFLNATHSWGGVHGFYFISIAELC